ncbi:MAG: extracellular solute-binding protein, partial [Rhodothermales bacterium]
WWEDAETPVNLMASGDVVMVSAFNGRIFNGRKAGKPVLEVWNDGLRDADWWVITSNSKHPDVAQSFVAFASEAAQQAVLPQHIPYGPANEAALDLLPVQVLQDLPTSAEHASKMIFLDSEWWRENQEAVEVRWDEWLGKR